MATNEEHKVLRGDTMQRWGDMFTTKHPTFDDLMQTGFVPQVGMVVPDGAVEFFAGRVVDGLALDSPTRRQRVWRWVCNMVRWR